METKGDFQAAIFDLDGVITDTARLHAAAWKELVDGYLARRSAAEGESHAPFDPEHDYRRYVDGLPRVEGLRSFFRARGLDVPPGDPDDPVDLDTVFGLAARKDEIFQRVLEERGVDVIEGTVELVRRLRSRGVRTAVASSSRNCRQILERAGLAGLFEARVDGETLRELGLAGKPEPDMFLQAAERLEAGADASAVFEDAVSGVEAARRGGFGLVFGVSDGSGGSRRALRAAGADLVFPAGDIGGVSVELLDAWFREREHRRPPVLGHWSRFEEEMAGREPVIFLDYDGTLTPIVERPEDAVLSPEMREVMRGLADRFPTTIVSGRGREDVEGLVGLDNVHYAGSHGFDISGPEGGEGVLRHEVAGEVVPVLEEVVRELEAGLAGVEGALVEPKRYTVAVHYRLVAERDRPKVDEVVEWALEGRPELRKATGKMVIEIRPELEWDKGAAVLWLLEALDLADAGRVPLYVGDDTTDEDAFRALEGKGIGVVVADAPRPTAAHYSLQDTEEVRDFLLRLRER